ncbi:hypothetical protein R75461_05965 [Paraburkholderia nemoris]|nr:hypothetical protein R75461_05965 [Paraburkholderia nemoris]
MIASEATNAGAGISPWTMFFNGIIPSALPA